MASAWAGKTALITGGGHRIGRAIALSLAKKGVNCVVQSLPQSDASETLAPPSVGGNQEPWEFADVIGGRLAMIGGVDQFNVVTDGSDGLIRQTVRKLFDTVGARGGYICSLSDHFFETPPEKLQVFADAARECVY